MPLLLLPSIVAAIAAAASAADVLVAACFAANTPATVEAHAAEYCCC